MHFFSLRPSLTVLASLLSVSALAQAPVKQLDQIVVTAARAPQLLNEVVGDVSVIGQEELTRAGQSSLAEILSRQPGLEFYNNGGPQTVTGISIRGAEARHTLVLINGMRINSSVTTAINLNTIDPASVERIEIIRGAASSLYGSDAIGGVINIITKQGTQNQDPQLYGAIGYGSQQTFTSSVGVDGGQNGFSYNLNASVEDSNGFNGTNRDNFSYYDDKDGYKSHAFTGALSYEIAKDQTIGLNAFNSYINGDFDAGDFYPDAFTQTRQQSYNIYSRNRLTSNWHSQLSFGLSKEQNTTPIYDSQYSTLQREYRWQNDIELTDDQQLTLLVERLEERINHTTDYTATKRNTNAVAAIYRAQLQDRHYLQASVRNDNISGYGNRTTGSLGYDFAISDSWEIGAAASTGFKAPSFTDLYSPLAWGYQGNPNLKAEKSRNIEAHVGYDNGISQLKITAFQNKVSDLIDGYVCNDQFECTSRNVDRASIRGVTLFGAHDFGNVNVWASADLINPKDNDRGTQLIRRAKTNLKAGAHYQWNQVLLGAEYQYTSKRYDDIANTAEKRLGGFSLVNLTADYTINKNFSTQIRWNNIFDKNYNTMYGYNMPGSNVFVNLSWRM